TTTESTPLIFSNFVLTAFAQPWQVIPCMVTSCFIVTTPFYSFCAVFSSSFDVSGLIPSLTTEGLNLLSLAAFKTTDTELKLIAAAANIGFNKGPPNK